MLHLHQITWFKPIKVADLNPREIKIAFEWLKYLVGGKGERSIERTCANGIVKRAWIQKEETSSPIAYLEYIMLT